MIYEIWMEGYTASGDSGVAHLLGKYEGETFMEAYLKYVKTKYKDDIPDYVRLNEPVIWGCRCYDNEKDARKYFG
jgi:hypothetical protein